MNKKSFLLFLFLLLIGTNNAYGQTYNFTSTYSIPIKMNILEEISTKEGLQEGSVIKLKAVKTIYYKGYPVVNKDDIITARVETVVEKGMNGFPAVILDNFEIKGIKKSQLLSTYTKKGFNACLLVYPLKWALTPIPFVGSLTNFIKGGEAKIKTDDLIIIKYYPEWS